MIAVVSLLGIALLVYASFILIVNYQRSTAALVKESKLQSQLIADYAVTPLLFSDVTGAVEILNKLKGIPNINAAALYNSDRQLFASYSKNHFFFSLRSAYVKQDFTFLRYQYVLFDHLDIPILCFMPLPVLILYVC